MTTWLVTQEKAMESRPPDFGAAGSVYTTVASDLDDVSGVFLKELDGSWDNFHGKFSAGLSALGDLVGERALEMSRHAGDVEAAYLACEDELEDIKKASDTLLTDAEELLEQRDAAETSHGAWDTSMSTRRTKRNTFDIGTDDRKFWHQLYRTALTRRNEFGVIRDDRESDLDGKQTDFDDLREDEAAAHQTFADALGDLDVTNTAVVAALSPTEAASVSLLITYLDARLLSVGEGGGSPRARARLYAAIKAAREAIADMTGTDTEEQDHLVAVVQAKREIQRVGAETIAEQISQANADGNLAEAQRLAALLALGTEGMTDEERDQFLTELFMDLTSDPELGGAIITIFATYDGEIPDWVIDLLLGSERTYGVYGIYDIDRLRMLADILGLDPNDPFLHEEVMLALYRKIVIQEGPDFITDLLGSGRNNTLAAQAAFEYAMLRPWILDDAIEAGGKDIQQYIDLFSYGSTQEQMDAMFGKMVSRMIIILETEPDASLDELNVNMQYFGSQVGYLLYQFGRAGEGSTYDASGFVRWMADVGLGAVPYGPEASKVIKGLENLIGGYQESDVYGDIDRDDREHADQTIVAMTALIAAGGAASEDLAAIVNSEGGIVEAYNYLQDNRGSDINQYVDVFREEIVDGVERGEKDD